MTHSTSVKGSSLILDEAAIERKMLRMAYEIYERNVAEKQIILAGIADRGTVVAEALHSHLQAITPFDITLLTITLNKAHPLDAVFEKATDCSGKTIIIVDDVANSGRTIFYGMRPLMDVLPKRVQTAVLIDRMHKSFPVSVDYTGYRLSTTLQEKVVVDMVDGKIKGAYLE